MTSAGRSTPSTVRMPVAVMRSIPVVTSAVVYSAGGRLGRLKLIYFPDERRVELYDLGADIGESRNLAATLPEERDRLLALLNEWRKKVGAAAPRLGKKR